MAKPMTAAMLELLRRFGDGSYRNIDLSLRWPSVDALKRRGYIENPSSGWRITDAGRDALADDDASIQWHQAV